MMMMMMMVVKNNLSFYLEGKYCLYIHFVDREIEAQKVK